MQTDESVRYDTFFSVMRSGHTYGRNYGVLFKMGRDLNNLPLSGVSIRRAGFFIS